MSSIENPPSTSDGSRIMRPATCMHAEGVSMYRNVASMPVRRCMVPESSQHDLAAQPPTVPRSVAEPLDGAVDQPAGGLHERTRVEDVVPRRALRRTIDGAAEGCSALGPPFRRSLRCPAGVPEQASETQLR